jgi:hypothetical protein
MNSSTSEANKKMMLIENSQLSHFRPGSSFSSERFTWDCLMFAA